MGLYSKDICQREEVSQGSTVCSACKLTPHGQNCRRLSPNALLDKHFVQQLLGCSQSQLKRMIAGGEFPKPRVKVGNTLKWKVIELEQWLQHQLAARNQMQTSQDQLTPNSVTL